MEVDEKIADFFEARPHFYDICSHDYKNRQKRDSQLAVFAPTIGMTPQALWKRFCSL